MERKLLIMKALLLEKATKEYKKDTPESRAKSNLLHISAREIEFRYGNTYGYLQHHYEAVEEEAEAILKKSQ